MKQGAESFLKLTEIEYIMFLLAAVHVFVGLFLMFL
jgi:hypothetical protein